jgi:hypothetical protein
MVPFKALAENVLFFYPSSLDANGSITASFRKTCRAETGGPNLEHQISVLQYTQLFDENTKFLPTFLHYC